MNGHMLKLASGGCLNLNELPPQEGVTLEMLQASRDRIFLLESQAAAAGPVTPSKVARGPRTPASSSKAVTPAQVTKEKKSIVKEIKKRITPLKFYQGWDKVGREVKFAADRVSPEAAEQMLGITRDAWSSATVQKVLGRNLPNEQSIENTLALVPGELTGSVWMKGGAMGGRRFGAVKARRLGNAVLSFESMKLSYTVKSQRLTGSLVCINESSVTSNKRRRSDGSDEDIFGSDDESDADMFGW